MNNNLRFLLGFLALSLLYESEVPAEDVHVAEAIKTMGDWWVAHPVSLTTLNADGRYLNAPYTFRIKIFNYLDKNGRENWRFLDQVTRTRRFQFCAYKDSSNKVVLYFPKTKQLIEYDPTQHFTFLIDDWLLRKQIDLDGLRTVLSNAEVSDGQQGLHELKFDFDANNLHSKLNAATNTSLSLSIFFTSDGEIRKCSRTLNSEIVTATVEHSTFDNNEITKQLPEIPSGDFKSMKANYFDSIERELNPQSPIWLRAVIIGVLACPLIVILVSRAIKRMRTS